VIDWIRNVDQAAGVGELFPLVEVTA